MSSKKKYALHTVGAVSLSFNFLVLYVDTISYLLPKIKQRYFPPKLMQTDSNFDSETLIMKSAVRMINYNHTVTIWNEPNGFTQELAKKIKKIKNKESHEYILNNYPKAFLYYGLTEYAIKKKERVILDEVKIKFDSFISLQKTIKRVDQVPLGLAALNLYKAYGEKSYLDFSDKIFAFILSQMDENGIVSYRKNQIIAFPDTLGFVVPFLLKYKDHTDVDTVLIAKEQMDYFIEFGVSSKTYIPVHGVNRDNNVQVGSMNWGRGIGWYFMAIAYFHKETGEYKEEYYGLIETLSKLKNKQGAWGQFPGSKDRFDASATTLFIYSMIINNPEKFNLIDTLKMFDGYISDKGTILETSGDTYTLNSYSNTFGKSELSQGILLLILSKIGSKNYE